MFTFKIPNPQSPPYITRRIIYTNCEQSIRGMDTESTLPTTGWVMMQNKLVQWAKLLKLDSKYLNIIQNQNLDLLS